MQTKNSFKAFIANFDQFLTKRFSIFISPCSFKVPVPVVL